MAVETISSALAQEAVSQVFSRIKESYAEKSDTKEHIERMEMAHIKLEAAIETSNRWNITSAALLRWRSKLKRAAQECDHTLRRCRQRFDQEQEMKQAVMSFSFPKRVAHTATSFVSSIFNGGNDDELRGSTAVQRFERFADDASEFLRYVEFGGTPSRYMFSVPLTRHLLTGKGTKHCFVYGGQHLSLMLLPFSLPPDHGTQGTLIFILEDSNAPENNFILGLNLRLSESTDIVGVAVRCLQLFIPYLSSTTEIVKTKLAQVQLQDLCWVLDNYSVYGCDQQIHTMCSKWFRPNPFCCQKQDHPQVQRPSSESSPCDIYLEPVIQVYLVGHVALSAGNNGQRTTVDGESLTSPTRDFPYLKLGAQFWPHASEDLSPAVGGSASEIINDEAKQPGVYANISFEQVGEIMMPKAVDCLTRNVEATSYEMLWKSKHGGAHLRVEKTSWRANTRKNKVGKRRTQRKHKKVPVPVQGWASANYEFIDSWIAHTPAQFQSTVVDYWIQNEKRSTAPLLLKTSACVNGCPITMLCLKDHSYLARKLKMSST